MYYWLINPTEEEFVNIDFSTREEAEAYKSNSEVCQENPDNWEIWERED